MVDVHMLRRLAARYFHLFRGKSLLGQLREARRRVVENGSYESQMGKMEAIYKRFEKI
jgi:hypothetical protein